MLKSRFPASSTLSAKGNVLFLILIAVMLFAALTAAITRSNQGTSSMDRERGSIDASDIMGYGAAVEKTVARMLGNDMSENSLSFQNDNWQYNNNDPVEPSSLFGNCTDTSCMVFDPAGGGMAAQTFGGQLVDAPVATDVKSGHGVVYSMKVTGVGSSDHDLVMMIAVIDMNTCKAINNSLHITNPSGFPPVDTWASANVFDGTFSGPANGTDEIGDIGTALKGKTSGCVTRSGGAYAGKDNYFYQVLLPR